MECSVFTYPSPEDSFQIANPDEIVQRLIPALRVSLPGFTRFTTPPGSVCAPNQLVCPSQQISRCLSQEALCDGFEDCDDAADEGLELCGGTVSP